MLEIAGIVAFFLLIMGSIALHEIGHLVPAKKFGVRVPEYMVGFGPTLISWRRGETRYGIKAFPLGGYIRMIGMLPPPPEAPEGSARSMTTGRAGALIQQARQQSLEEILPEDTNRVFYKLPPWKRIIIMMGGPTMNLVLAAVLFTIVLSGVGLAAPTTTIDRVMPCVPTASTPTGLDGDGGCVVAPSAAAAIGLASGDSIVAFNGEQPTSWVQLNDWIRGAGGAEVVLTVSDATGMTRDVPVTVPVVERAAVDSRGRPTGETVEVGYLGIQPTFTQVRQPIWTIPGYMLQMTQRAVEGILTLPVRFYELVTETLLAGGERSPESPVSVVGASRIGGEVVASDQPAASKAAMFLGLAASINLFLFLFNLLPVLPLDGGHVAGAMYESLRRRINKMLGRKDPGAVDVSVMLPFAYVSAAVLMFVGGVVIVADVFRPLSLL